MQKIIGTTTLAKIQTQNDMNKFVKSLGLTSNYLIIKPNWVQPKMGTYTDAQALDMFLTAVKKRVIIVESYTFWRTDKYAISGKDYFPSKEADLINGKKHWKFFKKMDDWFLQTSGIGDILKKHKAEYLNITNEVWENNVADLEEIKKIAESNYSPVAFEELYSFVPNQLLGLKGADFISFSKAKKEKEYGFTLSTKNLFGLIPAPRRYPFYHGKNDELLAQNIADINKIYRSLFNCFFIVEGIFTASDAKSMEETFCIKDWGIILGGKNSIEVDAIAAELLLSERPQSNIDTLKISKSIFGNFDKKLTPQIPKSLKVSWGIQNYF